MANKEKCTLHYFDLNGRGEYIRRMFRIKGVDFIDNRMKMADWRKFKDDYKWQYCKLPMLELPSGIEIYYTNAIIHYVARELELEAEDSLEKALCEELMEGVNDLILKCTDIKNSPGSDRKTEAFENFKEFYFPFYIEAFEKLYSRRGGPYLLGQKLTYADVYLTTFFDTYKDMTKAVVKIPPSYKYLNRLILEVIRQLPPS